MLIPSGKTVETDKRFNANETNSRYQNLVFVRLVAMGIQFTNVDFRYSAFEGSYLRKCHFDSCNFTGCRFIGTQFSESKFSGCTFDYATFERTLIDPDVLDTECPGHENLKMRFARTLRMNFQQLGDTAAVNKAIKVELDATEIHLKKAWKSNESYYRKHHPGFLARTAAFFEWFEFKVLDLIWGNGENLSRLIMAVIIILCGMTIIDVFAYGYSSLTKTFFYGYLDSFEIFFGTLSPPTYNKLYLAIVTCLRLISVGFFLSIIIKRFNRR